MAIPSSIKVLCVDDEPNILDGLQLHLRRKYNVLTAPSGQEGLRLLESDPSIAVVVSDMRMPGMDGATFLARARQLLPDAARLLLTGYTDLDSAISAVNEGQVFRFLTKPCAPPNLMQAVSDAAEQHRLVTAERVLLEQTLQGSIKALVDVLAVTSPVSFSRAGRLKTLASEIAVTLGMKERWQLEVAALVSQLGNIALPPETAEKVYYGQPLLEHERLMLAKAPALTEQLLNHIPRLEVVREILLAAQSAPRRARQGEDAQTQLARQAAQILRVAIDFDLLEAQGNAGGFALDTLRGRGDQYDSGVLNALAALRASGTTQERVRELPVSALRPGMVLAEDAKMASGALLAGRGYEITEGFVQRARNFPLGSVREPIRVTLPDVGRLVS